MGDILGTVFWLTVFWWVWKWIKRRRSCDDSDGDKKDIGLKRLESKSVETIKPKVQNVSSDYQIKSSYDDYNSTRFVQDGELDKSVSSGIREARNYDVLSLNSCKDEFGRYKTVSDFTVIDIETTGLSKYDDAILSLSAVRYRDYKPVKSYNQLLDPHCEISSFITKLTGITQSDVRGKPYMTDVIDDFMSFIGDDILVGHNIDQFDLPFLYAVGYPVDGYTTIDTWLMAKYELNRSEFVNLKLPILERFYKINQPSHRSLDDCYTCGEVYLHMARERIQDLKVNNLNGHFVLLLGEFYQRRSSALKRDLRICGAHISTKPTNRTTIVVSNGQVPSWVKHKISKDASIYMSLNDFFNDVNFGEIPKLNKSVKRSSYNVSIDVDKLSNEVDSFEKRIEVNMSQLSSREQIMMKNFDKFFILGDFARDWLLFHRSLHDLVYYFNKNNSDLTQSQKKVAYSYLYRRCIIFLRRMLRYDTLYKNRTLQGKRAEEFLNAAFKEASDLAKFFERNDGDINSLSGIVNANDSFRSYANHLTNNATSKF